MSVPSYLFHSLPLKLPNKGMDFPFSPLKFPNKRREEKWLFESKEVGIGGRKLELLL